MSHLLVVCAKRYNGHELWTLLGVLQGRGHTFEVASQATLIRDELTLQPNTIERTVYEVGSEELQNESFQAMCVVSGNMEDTEKYWRDEHVMKLLRSAKEAELVIAAICCSVPTLGPVVEGVPVSYFPLVRSRHHLERYKAVLQNVSLTVDVPNRTITAENQMITQMWADEICNMLEGKDPQYHFTKTDFMPKGGPRRMPKEVEQAMREAGRTDVD